MLLAQINQETAAEAVKNCIAVLPIGATEVHGNHLPVGTDSFLAAGVAWKLEERLGSERCLVLPCVPYGQVWSLRETAGTVDIPDAVLTPYLVQIAMSMYRAGVRKFVFLNAHVGNNTAIKAAMREVYAQCDMKVYAFTYPGAEAVISRVCTSKRPHKAYFHACEIETSYMLYLCPEQVDMSKAISQYPVFPDDFDVTPHRWTEIMPTAVLGDATAATAEKGKEIIDAVVENMAHLLGE